MKQLISTLVALLALCTLSSSFAQQSGAQQHNHGDQTSQQPMNHEQQANGQGGMMQHGDQGGMMQHDGQGGMMQGGMMSEMMSSMMQGRGKSQNSREGFSAIQDRVRELEADPETDWSQIDIDALRLHLIDMDRVIMQANVTRSELDNGMRYVVTGDDEVAASIKRMVPTHATQMSNELDWTITTREQASGVVLEVTAQDAKDVAKIRALGFSGFMVLGDHHEPHHQQMSGGGDHASGNGNMSHQH